MAFLSRISFSLFNRVAKSTPNVSVTPVTNFTTPLGVAYFATEAPKRRRKASDERPPKRPGSPYSFFVVEQFPKFKQQNPDVPFAEASKQIAAQWKKLSEAEKKKYDAAFNTRVQRYEKELSAYDKLHPKPPTKPATAFLLYLAQLRKENPNLKTVEISKIGGKKWASLAEADKKNTCKNMRNTNRNISQKKKVGRKNML